jgi:hypothetical protein
VPLQKTPPKTKKKKSSFADRGVCQPTTLIRLGRKEEKNSMAGLSSSSSPPPLTDEEEYDSIRPKSSRLRYDRLGYISEEVMNELATDWKLRGESKGLLQSIWSRHPINPINKLGNKIILNQIK